MVKTRTTSIVLFIASLAAFWCIHGWLFRSEVWFVFDDFAWLFQARFQNPFANFTYWPIRGYNDRPVGATYFQVLYNAFGLDARAWHLVGLSLHVANGILLFDVLGRLNAQRLLKLSKFTQFFAPVVFLVWAKSTLAVQWPAAVFDLLGAFFIFLSIDLFLTARTRMPLSAFMASLGSLVSFYLGLRTKELAVVVMAVVTVVSFMDWRMKRLPLRRIAALCLPTVALGLAFMTTIFLYIHSGEHGLKESSSPYQITFNPLLVVKNAFRYLTLFYDAKNPAFDFNGTSGTSIVLSVLFVISACAFFFFRKIWSPLIALVYFFVFLGPVLLMKNMQHMLYLYTASAAMSIFLASLAEEMGKRFRTEWCTAFCALSLMAYSVYLVKRGNVSVMRASWASLSSRDHRSYLDLVKIYSVIRPTRGIGVFLEPNGYNIFYPYGPGYINNLILGDSKIKTILSRSPTHTDLEKADLWLGFDESSGKIVRNTSFGH